MKKKQDWDSIVAAFEVSGLAQAEFCTRKKVGLAAFKKHLYRVRAQRAVTPMFSELSIKAFETLPCKRVEFHFPDGTFLRFPDGTCPSDLQGYIAVLGR
jgi:hypothetical protein